MFAVTANSQHYLRGEVKDEKFTRLQNVKIFVHSARSIYYSGVDGSFGIILRTPKDTLTFSLEGYEELTIPVDHSQWQNVVLKVLVANANKNKQKLISVTKDKKQDSRLNLIISDETYFALVENDIVNAERFPNTGFSLNVNKASYSNVRRFLNMGSLVPPDAVKAEELVNYFNLHYSEPAAGETFKVETQVTDCPWKQEDQLLYINVSAKKLNLDKVPPSNFVFLIDVSGSMDLPNKLPLLQAAFQLFVKNLRDEDKVSIVVYGGSVGVWLQPTSGSEKEKIIKSIEELTAQGDTPGESAIRMAYKVAKSTFITGGNNRIILATDGDFNVGETTEKALDELISRERQSGVYLTCIGVGMGNLKDSKLQVLAKKGNGNYAYLDNINEAEKTLVQELTQTLYAVADDAVLNIEFNPAMVKKYRLIGFDNKKEALANNSVELEGGEVGSGNSTMAIFQITPTDMNMLTPNSAVAENIAEVTVRYSQAGDTLQRKMACRVPNNFLAIDEAPKPLKFAASVSLFAMKLKNSPFATGEWQMVEDLARASADNGNFLQAEYLKLVETARKLYDDKKRKKKRKKGADE